MNVSPYKSLLLQYEGMRKQLIDSLQDNRKRLEFLNVRSRLIDDVQLFLQKIAQDTQSNLRIQVEDIVNLALDTCFPNEYVFSLDFRLARGKTEAELIFKSKKTGRVVDPMNGAGGGVVDLTAFALRIASYVLERGVDNVIVLDEPFRFISRDLQLRAGEILRTLSTKLNLQIIMVTHITNMIDIANKVFEVKKNDDGISVVKER